MEIRFHAACRTSHFKTELSRLRIELSWLIVAPVSRSMQSAVGVGVTDWALFVDDCSFDVRAGFVFDVDGARFLVALQYHFLMARCKHVVGRCSFYVTMTRALCKVPRQQRVLSSVRHSLERTAIGVLSSPINMLSVASKADLWLPKWSSGS